MTLSLPRAASFKPGESALHPLVVASRLERRHPGHLLVADVLVDVEDRERLLVHHVLVDAHDDLLLPLHRLLELEGRLLDLALREAALDGRHHSAHRVDLAEVLERLGLDVVR